MIDNGHPAVRANSEAAFAAIRVAPARQRTPAQPPHDEPVPPSGPPGSVTNLMTGSARTTIMAGQIGPITFVEGGPGDESAPDDTPWLAALWANGVVVGARVEMRYLTLPNGSMNGYLLVRTPDPASVVGFVERLCAEMPSRVQVLPVTADQELAAVLDPFQPGPNGIVEIRKHVTAQQVAQGPARGRWLTAVTPWRRDPRPWGPLWAELQALRCRSMFSVGLAPFPVGPGLSENLQAWANRLRLLAAPAPSVTAGIFGGRREPDQFAELAVPVADDVLRRYLDRVFQIRVSLATDRPLPGALANLIANAVSPRLITADGFLGEPATVVWPHPAEVATAWQNVVTLDFAPLPMTYRQGLPTAAFSAVEEKLCGIADIDEAAAAFHLPHEGGTMLPVFG